MTITLILTVGLLIVDYIKFRNYFVYTNAQSNNNIWDFFIFCPYRRAHAESVWMPRALPWHHMMLMTYVCNTSVFFDYSQQPYSIPGWRMRDDIPKHSRTCLLVLIPRESGIRSILQTCFLKPEKISKCYYVNSYMLSGIILCFTLLRHSL